VYLSEELLPLLLRRAQALMLRLHGVTLHLQQRPRLMETDHLLLYVRVGQLLHTGRRRMGGGEEAGGGGEEGGGEGGR